MTCPSLPRSRIGGTDHLELRLLSSTEFLREIAAMLRQLRLSAAADDPDRVAEAIRWKLDILAEIERREA